MKRSEHNTRKLEKFRAILQKNSLRATAQRMAVHEAMMELGHACAEDVYHWIAANSETSVTVASVYNILSQMETLGIYQSRPSSDSKMHFDITTHPHLHMYDCVKHKFRDLGDDVLQQQIADLIGQRRFKGYNIERIDVQFIVRPVKKKKISELSK